MGGSFRWEVSYTGWRLPWRVAFAKSAIQPRGDNVAAALPLDQYHECEEKVPGEVGYFGRQHSLVRPGTISTQYFFRFECRKYHRGTGSA